MYCDIHFSPWSRGQVLSEDSEAFNNASPPGSKKTHLPLSLAWSFKTSTPSPSSRKQLWDKTHTQKPLEFVQINFCWHLKQIPWNWPQIFKMSLLGNGNTMAVERELCTPGYTNSPNQRVKNKESFVLNGYKTHIHQIAVVQLETKAYKQQVLI